MKFIECNINRKHEYVELIESFMLIKNEEPVHGMLMGSNPYYCKDSVFRVIVNPKAEISERAVFGINFEPQVIEIIFWIAKSYTTPEKFIEFCQEPYKSIFLFNLDLIT
jgi:hypothetical protein